MNTPKIVMYDIGDYKALYIAALERHGAEAALFSYVDSAKEAAAIAASYDGLLLPGGGDVSPTLYNMPTKSCCGEPDSLRDEVEMLLVKAFADAGKPVLGICRGCQLINVAFGGTLYQDIKAEKGTDTLAHFDKENKDKPVHTVSVSGGSLLAGMVGAGKLPVNSVHHQAVRDLGRGMVLTAVSPDGVAEAIEAAAGFVVGVQWHPEVLSQHDEVQDKIFAEFVGMCQKGTEPAVA